MPKTREKSLKLNMALNAIKGLMGIIFPLISFPYVSRILGVDNLGRYSFATSIVSYFVLFSALGIGTYAIREGAQKREDPKEINLFGSEMFSINLVFVIITYLLFITLILLVDRFRESKLLLLIFSLEIIFKLIGIEWIYSVFEDYLYITIRSIFFQIVSLILLFLFVKSEVDLNVYAIITVVANGGSSLLNFIYAKKYIRIRPTFSINWRQHFKPIIVLFATTMAVTVYVSSDITILGFLCDDRIVGIYTFSTKIYSIIKTILSAIIVVSIPRLSALIRASNNEKYAETAFEIYSMLLTIMIPCVVGVICLRENLILLISGEKYIAAASSLMLLSIALFFCLGAWFWGQCILVPQHEESFVLKITIVSAVSNIVLNFLLIPFFKENGAALTTILAEAISFVYCRQLGKKYVHFNGVRKIMMKTMIGSVGVGLCCVLCIYLIPNVILSTFISVLGSIVIYFGIEILTNNIAVTSIVVGVLTRRK